MVSNQYGKICGVSPPTRCPMDSSSELIFDSHLADFDTRVLRASAQYPVLVDFWAEWCASCLVIAPALARVVRSYGAGLSLAKVEVDEGDNMKLAGRYRVRGFPTVILFRAGQELGRFSGARSPEQIRAFLDHALAQP